MLNRLQDVFRSFRRKTSSAPSAPQAERSTWRTSACWKSRNQGTQNQRLQRSSCRGGIEAGTRNVLFRTGENRGNGEPASVPSVSSC